MLSKEVASNWVLGIASWFFGDWRGPRLEPEAAGGQHGQPEHLQRARELGRAQAEPGPMLPCDSRGIRGTKGRKPGN